MEALYNNLIRVEAFDGIKLYSYNNICLTPGYDMSRSEIACSLSHLKAIYSAYKNGDKHALIMEDDIYNSFEYLWKDSIEDIIKFKPRNVECIQLHCINPDIINKMLLKKERFVKWCEQSWGAGCYYITRKGMRKIVKKYIKNNIINLSISMKNKADINLIYGTLNTVVYTRPLFEHQISESTIHPSHLDTIHFKALCIICNYFNMNGKV